jgi:CelD/BcsL family acetyltransferase involved in cellulose biosynthesis
MIINRLTTAAELDRLAEPWNALAGDIPFRRHQWLAPWWRYYGASCKLYTLVVHDTAENLIGIAPLFLGRSPVQGRVLRLLGSGEVCSEYVGILCRADHAAEVVANLAEWLCTAADDRENGWDALRLEGVDSRDEVVARLAEELASRGCLVDRRHGPNCWRVELPSSWAAYEASLSKSHRKQVRRLIDRTFDSGRAVLHTVTDKSQLAKGRQILIDLHQRRRLSLGQPGCFSSSAFAAFHEEAMERLLPERMLRLHWLELDGEPAAAEYHVSGGGVIYGYQAGVAPELLQEEPGRLAAIATLRLAVEQGFAAFDFLRGDEPYKAHFRAQPRPLVEYRIAPRSAAARWRHRAWSVRENVKEWWRTGREDASGSRSRVAKTS